MSNELIIKVDINNENGYTINNLNLTSNTPTTQIYVDWGDEHSDTYANSISNYAFSSIEHTYSEDGEYTITITGVSGINSYFLRNNNNVIEVIIPNHITSLSGTSIFSQCRNLEKVVLPNGISSIGYSFCFGCSNLVELVLPDGLTTIEGTFLYGCGLEEVILTHGVSEIPAGSFGNMAALTSIIIPTSVTTISYGVLGNVDNLSYLNIPNSVNSIDSTFLQGLDGPITIKFNSEIPPTMGSNFLNITTNYTIHIPEGSLNNYLNQANYPNDSSKYVEYPTLKHKLETLGKLIASNLTKQFVSASWDEGLTTLANKISDIQGFNDIFEFDSSNNYASNGFGMMDDSGGCSYFTLKIPSTITTLGDSSFEDFTEMKICEIPSSVVSIGNDVFKTNHSLEKIIFKGTTPPSATSSSFVTNAFASSYNIPTTCVIEVPCNALSAYKSATNYPDPTVYTYQCIRFDEKCDSSNGLSNFELPILLASSGWHGTSTMNYNSNMNAYALSGHYWDGTVFSITQLDGQENFMMSCEINISDFSGQKVGLAITPPETGEETTSNKYAIIVYITTPSNNQTSLQCMSANRSGTVHNTNQDLTINIENLDWVRLCFMSDTTSSGSIIGRVEKLDGTILGTQTFERNHASSYYPQISNRKCGIYFLGNNDDNIVNIYIRNIKCIGY